VIAVARPRTLVSVAHSVYELQMRNLAILAALVVIAACGPSNRDVALAKTARYQGDKLVLFAAAKAATESKHKLDASDETTLTVLTKGRWYTPDGLVSNWTPEDAGVNSSGRKRGILDQSISIALVVKLLPDTDKWIVHIEPIILRYTEGRPNFDKLSPKDPSIPGFATGKVDQLAFEIYSALKPYEVKGVRGVVPTPDPAAPMPSGPAPDPAPAPAPDPAPTPSGSAAPAP